MKFKIVVTILAIAAAVFSVMLIWNAGDAYAIDIDNDYFIGYRWTPSSNEDVVDHYVVRYWGTGFGAAEGTVDTDTAFVVLDVTPYPGIYQVDSVKVAGVNIYGEEGEESDPADIVEIHILPEKPGRPYWTPDNE